MVKAFVVRLVLVLAVSTAVLWVGDTHLKLQAARREIDRLRSELDVLHLDRRRADEKARTCRCGCGEIDCKCAQCKTDKPNPAEPWCKPLFGVDRKKRHRTGELP